MSAIKEKDKKYMNGSPNGFGGFVLYKSGSTWLAGQMELEGMR